MSDNEQDKEYNDKYDDTDPNEYDLFTEEELEEIKRIDQEIKNEEFIKKESIAIFSFKTFLEKYTYNNFIPLGNNLTISDIFEFLDKFDMK